MELTKEVEILKKYMDESSYTTVVTGSGISYLYGMSRLKNSIGRDNARQIFSPDYIRSNPQEFYKCMKDAFLDATFEKGPSKVHKQLAKLEDMGKINGIITQNMDCLHTIAGSKNVVEFQGSFQDNICIDCKKRYNDYNVWNQGDAPRCQDCGGVLMPASFYRSLSSTDEMGKAIEMIAKSDLIIIIGTTGFRSNEYLSKMKDTAKIVQINPSSTVFDSIATLNIKEDASRVLDLVLE